MSSQTDTMSSQADTMSSQATSVTSDSLDGSFIKTRSMVCVYRGYISTERIVPSRTHKVVRLRTNGILDHFLVRRDKGSQHTN